jgi:hypothetical protein
MKIDLLSRVPGTADAGPSRRRLLAALGVAALAGCGVLEKPRSTNAQGQYCYRPSKRGTTTCSAEAIPSEQVEQDVKRFEADPQRLTVFVVRKRWGDTRNTIDFQVDGGSPIATVPESFVRIRLSPGEHHLALRWDDQAASTVVRGRAGEIRFVEIVGNVWAGGTHYAWRSDDESSTRQRALKSRLIGLVDQY